jgi:hypothetical protein
MEEHSVENLPYPDWQAMYRDALIELDHDKLKKRVREAESAIIDRLQTLPPRPESLRERQAIRDALANLRCLKRETPDFQITCNRLIQPSSEGWRSSKESRL